MALHQLYRSFLVAGFSAAVLLHAGCEELRTGKHKTIKQEQYERWDMAKISIEYQLAQQQYAAGELDKCKATVDTCLAMKRPHAGLHMLAGKVALEQGELETAASQLKEAIRIDPKDPEPYYLLGVVYQRWQKMEVAEDYYQQAYDRKSTDARYMLAVVEMEITRGNLDKAQEMLEDKLTYFEQTAAVRIALARIAGLKNDYATAAKFYRDAFVLLPEDESVKRSYAEALYFAGKYSEAVPLLEDLHSRPISTSGETKDAKQFTEADRRTLTLLLGEAYLHMHRAANARNCFQDVLRERPDNLTAVIGLGKVCVEMNELSAALSAARKALKLDPKSTQAMILTAMVQQKQKKYSESITTLENALAITPKDSTVLCMIGVSQLKLGKQAEAVASFEKATAANPKDTWASDLLGRARPVIVPAEHATSQQTSDATSVTTAAPERRPTE